ncbi:MAG: class I SAM-dependent methyltransferase [Myxococcaceae bacterium]|nr:class I SAM-dependent methyltransferase [Myxococcaceae bacterium]
MLPEADTAEIVFGPLRCTKCHASFPVAEGVVDLVVEREAPSGLQRGLERPWVARSYERYLRPAVTLALSRRRFDRESEYLLYRSLLGTPTAPVLDLCCGTALFARRLAREPNMPTVIALDVSKAMIEEAVAQAREANATVDFVRAEAPLLPFADEALGAILQAGSLHFIADADRLFGEIARVLRPGGRYVATSYLPPRFGAGLHHRAGLYPRSEAELRGALTDVGLVGFERMVMPPFLLVKAEKPRRERHTVH